MFKLLLIVLAAAALTGCDKPVHEVRTLTVPPVLLRLHTTSPATASQNV